MNRFFTRLPFLLLLICLSTTLLFGAVLLVKQGVTLPLTEEVPMCGGVVLPEGFGYRNDYLVRQAGAVFNKTGQLLFEENCTVCHTAGYEVIVGPGLAGVTEKHDRQWLHRFITNSEQLVAEGDSAAVAIYRQYNNTLMPAYNFSTAELDSILSYLHYEGLLYAAAR